jgi:hypothetical protein
MKYNLDLFGRIAIVGILSSFIHAYILAQIGSNSAFFRIPPLLAAAIIGILIGFAIFMLMHITGHTKFIKKKNVNILCIILAVSIILPPFIEYNIKVPPADILNDWKCTGPHELCIEAGEMWIIYNKEFEWRSGYLSIQNTTYAMYDRREFTWQYDRLSKEITLYEADYPKYFEPKLNGWKIKLKLEITTDKQYYNMITYYINSSGKTPIDAKLFDGVTWTTSPYIVRGPYYKDNKSSITYVLPPGSTPPRK